MTRVHDMGGRFGDGPVVPEPQGIAQPGADWHSRALAVSLACGTLGQWNIDISRHARECISPKDYARFSYYEKWMAGLADVLVQTGVLTAEDLQNLTTQEETGHPLSDRMMTADNVVPAMERGGPADRPSNVVPKFTVGQSVCTAHPAGNRLVDGGHTRLPAYAQGAKGRILRLHGTHVFPDSNAHGMGEAPEPLYAVAFAAAELWTAPEHPNDDVILDLWQSYLVPA
jgi:nitrile hydratase subunit beta